MEVNLPNFADLNNDKEVNGSNSRDGPLKQGNSFMLSDGRVTNSMPNQTEFVAALLEVQHANFTLEQLENKLAVGKVIRDVTFAFALYRKYASLKGFNVRVGRNEKSKDASYVIGKWFFCSCEGYTGNKRVIDKKSVCLKSSFRCGCEAKLKIGRKREEEWKVTRFDKQHNHDIYSEDQTYLLRSSRYVPDDTVELLNSMSKSRIATARAFDLFSDLAGGRENVGFTKKDADNALYRANRKAHLENRDSIELVQHFIKKTNAESNFYWNIEVDDDKRLLNFFFRDSRCRVDYELFGGVISFDTTYKTNKYDLICAPFVGINHHKENILFGVGFLSDETEYSFEWLFATFLESMGGQQPTCIFTDQCQSMMNAIPTSFPRAHHRLCRWHIDQNSPSHFEKVPRAMKGKAKSLGGITIECINHEISNARALREATNFQSPQHEAFFMSHSNQYQPSYFQPSQFFASHQVAVNFFPLSASQANQLSHSFGPLANSIGGELKISDSIGNNRPYSANENRGGYQNLL